MEIDPPRQDPTAHLSQQVPTHAMAPPPANSSQPPTDNSALLDMLKQQTLLIQSLQATIAGLQDELKRMREESNKPKNQEDDDSKL